MNHKSTFPFFIWLVTILIFAIVATGPTLSLAYHLIVFRVAPALQVAGLMALGH